MMKKRILALLLTVCMLLSLMPLGAFAEENSEDIQILAEGSNENEGGSGNQDPCADGHSYVWTSNGNGTHTQVCSVCKATGSTADLYRRCGLQGLRRCDGRGHGPQLGPVEAQ